MLKTIDSGIYILVLKAIEEFYIEHKLFNEHKFNKGYYYYIGSAQRNFGSRLKRHLLSEKIIKWHIDHLTTNKNIKLVKIISFENKPKEYECKLSMYICKNIVNIELINNFGNSDCKICQTHLYFSKKNHIKTLEQLKNSQNE